MTLPESKSLRSKPRGVPALPPALARWADLFVEMPETELRIVAALVEALNPLVERIDGGGAQPQGEIDGIGRLGFRGGIERLLSSEWLWRDLDPDAFLQRAAERELLTLEPTYRQAAETGAALVLVDTGPDLIGAPRLVAFAALLCLGGLAQRRGSRLLWACTAMPEQGWFEGVAPRQAAILLKETAASHLGEAELLRMLGLPPAAREAARSEASLWLIGGDRLPDAPRAAHRIAIVERLRLDETGFKAAAQVTVSGASGAFVAASLDLPAEAEAVALLREPFRPRLAALPASAQPRPARAVSPGWAPASLAFTPGGEHLLVARPDGVLVFPTLGDGKALRLPVGSYQRLAGLDVTQEGIRAAFVTIYSEKVRIMLRAGTLVPDERLRMRVDLQVARDHPLGGTRFPKAALPPLGALRRKNRFWITTADGEAFLLTDRVAAPYSALNGGTLLAVCPAGLLMRDRTGTVVARHRSDGRILARFPQDQVPPERIVSLDVLSENSRHVLAIERDDGTWLLTASDGTSLPLVAPTSRIVGFTSLEPNPFATTGQGPAVLHLAQSGREGASLTFRDVRGRAMGSPIALPDTTLDVVRVATHPRAGPCIAAACLDAEGFVQALALRSLAGDWQKFPDMRELAEAAPCLRI